MPEDGIEHQAVAGEHAHFLLHLPRLVHDAPQSLGWLRSGQAHRHLQDRDPVACAAVVLQRNGHVRHEWRVRRRASFLEVAAHRHVDRRQHHVVHLGPAALRDLLRARKRQRAVRERPVGAGRCLQHVRRVDERRGKPASDAEPPQPLVPRQAGHVVRDAARFVGDAQQRPGRGGRACLTSFERRNRQHPLPDRMFAPLGRPARNDAGEDADEADAVDEPVVSLEVKRHAAVWQAREDVHLPQQFVARQQLRVDAADVPEQRLETAATAAASAGAPGSARRRPRPPRARGTAAAAPASTGS